MMRNNQKYRKLFEPRLEGFEVFGGGEQAQAWCPFHPDKGGAKKGFNVNLKTGLWHCYSCLAGGSAQKFLDLLGVEGYEPDTEYSRLSDLAGELRNDIESIDKKEMGYPPHFNFVVKGDDSLIGRKAYEYLIARGMTDESIMMYRIGYCHDGRYSGRLIIPTLNEDDGVDYFVARSFYIASGPPYINPGNSEFYKHKSEVLFNYCQACTKTHLVICEGVFDAIAVGPNAVAIFGKTISPKQEKLIRLSKSINITVALDGDAHREAITLAHKLTGYGRQISVAHFLPDSDPGSLERLELAKCLQSAEPVTLSQTINSLLNG